MTTTQTTPGEAGPGKAAPGPTTASPSTASKPISVGLLGFGRVGRDLFRLLYPAKDLRIGMVNDLVEPAALEYLLRFDTIKGRFPTAVSVVEGHLYVDGRQIPLLATPVDQDIPWGDYGVDIVVEATGQPASRERMERHLRNGARRVLLCVPPVDPPDATVVYGVNHQDLRAEHRIVSNASCTAHCAAPIVKILHDAFGIERAFLTTVHAYTNQQRLADVPAEDKRRGRAAAENIIPQATNAAEMVGTLLPELHGKIHGIAMNVPVANGSLVDLVCWHSRKVSVTAINEVLRTAAAGSYRGIVEYEDEPIVSSDVLQSPYSAVFDAQSTMVLGENCSKTVAWYDNSWGYANRLVDLIRHFAAMETAS